jgi:hypothetical protein
MLYKDFQLQTIMIVRGKKVKLVSPSLYCVAIRSNDTCPPSLRLDAFSKAILYSGRDSLIARVVMNGSSRWRGGEKQASGL